MACLRAAGHISRRGGKETITDTGSITRHRLAASIALSFSVVPAVIVRSLDEIKRSEGMPVTFSRRKKPRRLGRGESRRRYEKARSSFKVGPRFLSQTLTVERNR
jgi:hypothetical protein